MLQAEWPRAIEELTSFPHIEEAAVLSTCNRMELYVVALSWHRVSKLPYWLLHCPGSRLQDLDSLCQAVRLEGKYRSAEVV